MEAKAKALSGRRCVLCGGLALGLTACASPGNSLSFVSREEEARIGQAEHPKVLAQFGGAMTGPQADYVTQIGKRLAARTDRANETWTFSLLDDDLLNAFALPGGFVYATRGLVGLASNEAEVAGVIGHEIGHVMERHTAERLTGQQIGQGASIVGELLGRAVLGVSGLGGQVVGALSQGLLASFSRDQELEADRWGVRLLRDDGMDPDAMATFLERMDASNRLDNRIAGRPEGRDQGGIAGLLSTHPRTRDRVELAMKEAGVNTGGRLDEEQHRRRVEGLLWGDDPRRGTFANGEFLHAEAGYAMRVPRGWQPSGARAVSRQGGEVLQFSASRVQTRLDADDYLRQVWLRQANLRSVQGFDANGVRGAAAVVGTTSGQRQLDVGFLAVPLGPTTFARVQCIASRGRFRAIEQECVATAQSFRRLTEAETARIRPARIGTVRTGPRDTVASLAARMDGAQGTPAQREERFRLMNGLGADETVAGGTIVKLLVLA